MKTIDLKNSLISKISKIEDIEILKALETILMYTTREQSIRLGADQEAELSSAIEEGKDGKCFTQSEMDQKVQKWFAEEK